MDFEICSDLFLTPIYDSITLPLPLILNMYKHTTYLSMHWPYNIFGVL